MRWMWQMRWLMSDAKYYNGKWTSTIGESMYDVLSLRESVSEASNYIIGETYRGAECNRKVFMIGTAIMVIYNIL